MQLTTTFPTLLALLPTLGLANVLTVYNNCSFPLYYADVGPGSAQPYSPLPENLTIEIPMRGGGHSLKISKNPTVPRPLFQIETNLEPKMLWYDGSNVDEYHDKVEAALRADPWAFGTDEIWPITMHGFKMDSDCKKAYIDCPAEDRECPGVYEYPEHDRDEYVMKSCHARSNLTAYLCHSHGRHNHTSGSKPI